MSALAHRPSVRVAWRHVARQPLSLTLAVACLALTLLCVCFGAQLAPYDPAHQDLANRLLPPGALGADGRHWLGTEALGRDVLSLIIVAAAPALLVSLAAVLMAAVVGVALGVIAGYRGGTFEQLIVLVTNIQLAFPFFLLAITIVGILQPSVPLVIAVIALGSWVQFARVTYADTKQIRQHEFIEAVQVMRGSTARLLLRHILPNILPNVLVLATFAMGTAIVMESGLSFVGLGVPTETPTWGRALSEGRDYMQTAWWLTFFPGLAIFALVLSVNVVGEHVRDLSDPRAH